EDACVTRLGNEMRPFLAGYEGEGVARFQGAEDADESAFDALLADQTLGPLVFLKGAGAIEISALVFASPALGMLHERFRPLRRNNVDEMAAPHAEHVIDESFEFQG